MSTGLACLFVEVEPGQWFYLLQNWDCPVGAWDWMEYATAYGPFKSFEEAHMHLSRTQSNPGGYSRQTYQDSPISETIVKLTETAVAP